MYLSRLITVRMSEARRSGCVVEQEKVCSISHDLIADPSRDFQEETWSSGDWETVLPTERYRGWNWK